MLPSPFLILHTHVRFLTYLSLFAIAMPTTPENSVQREQRRRHYALNKEIINAHRRLLFANHEANLHSQSNANQTPIPLQNSLLPLHSTETFLVPLPSPLTDQPFSNPSIPSPLAYPVHVPPHVPPFPPSQQFLPIHLKHAHRRFRARIDALCPIQVFSNCHEAYPSMKTNKKIMESFLVTVVLPNEQPTISPSQTTWTQVPNRMSSPT